MMIIGFEKGNKMRRRIHQGIKKEILYAIRHYVLKFLGKRSHKSYFHRRFYQIVSNFLYRNIR